MKIYLAPLEGITGYTYRRALYQCFGGFDKYFIPIYPSKPERTVSAPEKRKTLCLRIMRGCMQFPQILTKNAEDFIQTAATLQEYGYAEVNSEPRLSVEDRCDERAEAQVFWTDRMSWTNSWMKFSANVM